MRMHEMKVAGVGASVVAALLLAGCGSDGEDRPPAYEPTNPVSAEPTSSPSAAETLPGAAGSGEPNDSPESSASPGATESAGDPNGSPAATASSTPTPAEDPSLPEGFSTPSPGPDDVAGNGVVAPSPSPAVEGDGRDFPGFSDQSTVDRSNARVVAIEAMRGLSVWDTTQDVAPGDAGSRVDDLVTSDALAAGAEGPGRWAPLWWRQATAAGAWSSAEVDVVPAMHELPERDGVEWVTVDVSWSWHASEDEVVPEGGAKTCTVAVEKEGGQQTVTAFDCQEAGSSAEESSS